MKKLFLICFFLVGIISANDVEYPPTSSFYLYCPKNENESTTETYVEYDIKKDKKFLIRFITNDNPNYFFYSIYTSDRISSDYNDHKFRTYKEEWWSSRTGGERAVRKRDNDEWLWDLDRKNLRLMSSLGFYYPECKILTKDEHKTALDDIGKRKDALIQKTIKDRKNKLKL